MHAEKILAISCRDESYDDFVNIGKRVNRLDGSIIVSVHNGRFDPTQLPPNLNHLRLLTLYLVNPPAQMPRRGHTLSVQNIGKAEEHANYVAAGAPIPQSVIYHRGITIDPSEWGEYVVLKPVHSSYAIGNLLVPTVWLDKLTDERIPDGHPLKTEPYLLQRFVDTGSHPCSYRVAVLLGQPLLCIRWTRKKTIRFPQSIDDLFSNDSFASNVQLGEATFSERTFELVNDDEVITFASEIFDVHAHLPLQGIDVVRDNQTGKLYVLENNSGGNVWTFSRRGTPTFEAIGKKALVNQLKAWDRAAEVLVRKTNELAK